MYLPNRDWTPRAHESAGSAAGDRPIEIRSIGESFRDDSRVHPLQIEMEIVRSPRAEIPVIPHAHRLCDGARDDAVEDSQVEDGDRLAISSDGPQHIADATKRDVLRGRSAARVGTQRHTPPSVASSTRRRPASNSRRRPGKTQCRPLRGQNPPRPRTQHLWSDQYPSRDPPQLNSARLTTSLLSEK